MSDFVLPAYGAELWSDPLNTALQWLHDNAAGIRTDLDSAANVAALAQTAASNAQTTANTANDTANTALDYAQGRIQVSYATVRPTPAADERVLWYDPNNGYQASYWDGISWVARPFGAGSLDNNAVLSRNIVAGAIGADQIAAGAIVAAKIAAGAVTADAIAAGSVTTDKLAAGAVTADSIAAGSITTDLLAAGAVTADTIAADAITADKLAAGAIDGTTITGATITGATIETAASGQRIVLRPDSDPQNPGQTAITFYSGFADEDLPASITANLAGTAQLLINSPSVTGHAGSEVLLTATGQASLEGASDVGAGGSAGMGAGGGYVSMADGGPLMIEPPPSQEVWINGPLHLQSGGGTAANTKALDWGTFSGTTDSNGNIDIPHNLGVAPKAVFIQMGNHSTTVAKVFPANMTGATFRAHFVNSTTGAAVASGVGMDGWYLALA